MDHKKLIAEARRRDRDIVGRPGFLTELADALEWHITRTEAEYAEITARREIGVSMGDKKFYPSLEQINWAISILLKEGVDTAEKFDALLVEAERRQENLRTWEGLRNSPE